MERNKKMTKWDNLEQIFSSTSTLQTCEIIVYNGIKNPPATVLRKKNTAITIPECNRRFQAPYPNIDKLFPLNLDWAYYRNTRFANVWYNYNIYLRGVSLSRLFASTED